MNTTHDLFVERYGKKYLDKIEHLRKRIIEYETGENQLVVIPLEAGLGKSLQSDRIIGEYWASDNAQHRRFLLVKRFVEDVESSVERINQHCGRIVALGITSVNWNEYKNNLAQLLDFPVAVITHERYVRLSRNPIGRKYFTLDRHTLIIDEALNQSIVSFSEELFRRIQSMLPVTLHGSLLDACKNLFDEISTQKQMKYGNSLGKCRPKFDKTAFNRFKRDVDANLHNVSPKDRDEVVKFVDSLEFLYNGQCLYNLGTISSFAVVLSVGVCKTILFLTLMAVLTVNTVMTRW